MVRKHRARYPSARIEGSSFSQITKLLVSVVKGNGKEDTKTAEPNGLSSPLQLLPTQESTVKGTGVQRGEETSHDSTVSQ